MSKNNSFETEQLTDSAYYILLALLKEQHGYAIMKFVEELTSGQIIIGPATLYTLIKKMCHESLIQKIDRDSDRKINYIVTDKGAKLIKKEVQRRMTMAQHGIRVFEKLNGRNENEK